METIAKITRWSYAKKLSLEDRVKIVCWYEEGYSVSKIASAFGVRGWSIRHHLQAAGVFEKDHKVLKWNQQIRDGQLQKRLFDKKVLTMVDLRLPLAIRKIYINMYEEDQEMAHRPKQRWGNPKPHQHQGLLADSVKKFDKVPFKAMYSFTL